MALALHDVGANKPRAEYAYTNAKRLELRRESLRHTDDCVLARTVRVEILAGRNAGHGCGIHEVTAFAMPANVGKESANAVQHSHNVHVEDPPPILKRDVVDPTTSPDTGIVANHVDISESLVRCLGSALDAARVGNITGNAAHPPRIIQDFDSLRQCVSFDISEHDFHALRHKGSTKREP